MNIRPNYNQYHSKVLDTYSIREAEQQIDWERQRYREEMQKWWEKLTLKEQKAEWKKDPNLVFYVTNPNKNK